MHGKELKAQNMISIIITSYKEPKTIGRAIESFEKQGLKNYELIISAPDEETLNVARKYAKKNKRIKIVKDKGEGKPAALNEIFKIARGEIVVLSDGDVYVSSNSVKKLTRYFSDKCVGAVSGRVVSTNPKNKMFGFWAYLLTEGFHRLREKQSGRKEDIVCSGYLYAIRNGIVKKIPKEILADDAYISLAIRKKGYETKYEPEAKVYVKYPDNLPDWIRQKKRTAGRFYQLKSYFKISKTSSLGEEILTGLKSLPELRSFKKIIWFKFLMIMRFYIWFRVFFDYRLWKRKFEKTWERVESTK